MLKWSNWWRLHPVQKAGNVGEKFVWPNPSLSSASYCQTKQSRRLNRPIEVTRMPAQDLGAKHVCYKCGTKFYQMKKPEAVCPKCGADQRKSPANKPATEGRRSRLASVPKVIEPLEPEEVEAVDEEEEIETLEGTEEAETPEDKNV